MDGLRELGGGIWFNLGDRDLAWCLERSALISQGQTPTAALARLNTAIGQSVPVLGMSDQPVRTWVSTPPGGWCAFQEFMIRRRAAGALRSPRCRAPRRGPPPPPRPPGRARARAPAP